MGDKSAIEWTDATWNPTWDGAIPMIGGLAPATCSALAADLLAHAADYAWPVTRVIDGDTVALDASADMPLELSDLKMQLRGVDTPEKGGRAKCDAERAAGRAATAFTRSAIAEARRIAVRDPAWGKWGGRIVAVLMLDDHSLAAALIAAGHGRAYGGGRGGNEWELQ